MGWTRSGPKSTGLLPTQQISHGAVWPHGLQFTHQQNCCKTLPRQQVILWTRTAYKACYAQHWRSQIGYAARPCSFDVCCQLFLQDAQFKREPLSIESGEEVFAFSSVLSSNDEAHAELLCQLCSEVNLPNI
jgi:hypothetical protein